MESLIVIVIIFTILSFILQLINLNKVNDGNKNQAELKALIEKTTESIIKSISAENTQIRTENEKSASNLRLEINNNIKLFGDNISGRMTDVSVLLKEQLNLFSKEINRLSTNFDNRLETLTVKVENNLKHIQEDNNKKLEEMRLTVDEKLHSTLEKRLSESFSLVSKKLEDVHKGLGEMQSLAVGVGDLKKVLNNVKVRGTWGEMQLKNLIDQVLTPDQYSENIAVKKGSRDVVEFAIKLPGKNEIKEDLVYLPIDSKFPLEDFQNLIEAEEKGDIIKIEEYKKALESRIKSEAKSISIKYLDPPATTDFAILFLPIEGLYAEVLRLRGVSDFIQREYRVVIAGPTNLLALLNSLQMGFRTVAIQKRSSEVWRLLGAVKTEFIRFGDILEKTQQKLDSASKEIGEASKRSRSIERKLQTVQEMPAAESIKVLAENELEE
ncbi:MAG: DNA recombination protein RmuC [bacterium]